MIALNLAPKVLKRPLRISSLACRLIVLRYVCQQIQVGFDDLDFYIDMVILYTLYLDVILGIDWCPYGSNTMFCQNDHFFVSRAEEYYSSDL